MKEWSIDEVKTELRFRSKQDGNGTVTYSLGDLESLVKDPRFPRRTNDIDVERIRNIVDSRKREI